MRTLTPAELKAKPYIANGRSVIQIDTLRNSTSITVALGSGAKDVVLYGKGEASLGQLITDAQSYPGAKLCAGEVEGRPIPGFDFGNSPLEFEPGKVHGKRVFYASTNNGSALALLLDHTQAADVYWACMLNGAAVGAAIREGRIRLPLLFLCAGFRGTMALEDLICAGQIILASQLGQSQHRITFDDGAILAVHEAERYFDPIGNIRCQTELCQVINGGRCGSVLSQLNKQYPDIEATVYGKGIGPGTLSEVRNCIPRLDLKSIPPCISRWIP